MKRGKHIKIIIGADGSCAIDALNFVGPSCRQATQEVAAALGVQTGHFDKPEVRLRECRGETEQERAR
jgi:hypothetical protein